MTNYIPHAMDTSNVILTEELNDLIEVLAKQIHEIWAEKRISQGWTYGSERNDQEKTTPCLVPYHLLPDDEKAYDRATVAGTIRPLLALGYDVIKKEK